MPDALVVVVAHHPTDGIDPDVMFVATQLTYIQAIVEGFLGANLRDKPKVVILFVGKFDVLSSNPADSEAAKSSAARIEAIFHNHFQSVRAAGKRASIPVEIIIGSALEGWSCQRVIEVVGNALYGF